MAEREGRRDSGRVKIYLYFIGKPKDRNTNAIAEDFVSRSAHYCGCEMREIRAERFDPWERHPSARKICLDPEGKAIDSSAFAKILAEGEMAGRDLIFLIGGHEGLPAGWRRRADLLLSLSKLTFPHELARAMAAEQIYRGLATWRGHPYPR